MKELPQTPKGWLKRMHTAGQSSRPPHPMGSDITEPETFLDSEDIKPERAALAGIMATRAYQRAKKAMLIERDTLSLPPTLKITTLAQLRRKSGLISSAFIEGMVEGIREDEKELQQKPQDDPSKMAYNRLADILEPLQHHFPAYQGMQITTDRSYLIVEEPSMVFRDIYGGVDALPANIDSLIRNTYELYVEKYGHEPDIQTLLAYVGNSYSSFIKPLGSQHKADSLFLIRTSMNNRHTTGKAGIFELKEKQVGLTQEIQDTLTEQRRRNRKSRSKTTRCSFLLSTDATGPFLDEPADFNEPLEDAFKLHMKLLAA